MEQHQTTPDELLEQLLSTLRAQANPVNVAGMARYGISTSGALGVGMPLVRELARDAKRTLGKDPARQHELAAGLWASGVHEARLMATLVDDPKLVDVRQAESWAADLDSWDICDGLCINLLRRTKIAWELAERWTAASPEFTKRAGFALIATLGVHDKAAPDERYLPALSWIEREATDERNAVKKAVNWALRQIGKRSATLNPLAIATAEKILADHPTAASARWIARDALRELRSEPVRTRLGLEQPG